MVSFVSISELNAVLRGVNEFVSILFTFICDLGEVQHKRAARNDVELLRVW
jgi:hypothetical protein